MAGFGTGSRLSSEQEQEKLAAYRKMGAGKDLTDVNTLEDTAFQQWSGGELPQGAAQAPPALAGLAAASPDASAQTALAATPGPAGGGTSLSGLETAAPDFKGFSTAGLASGIAAGVGDPSMGGQPAYGPGYLPNLGQRIYSNESSPLAGLRRIY